MMLDLHAVYIILFMQFFEDASAILKCSTSSNIFILLGMAILCMM